MDMFDKVNRRRFLKSSAGAISTVGVLSNTVGSVVANQGVDPLVLKGTRNQPVSVNQIDARRQEFLRNQLADRSDTLDEVVVGTPDISEGEFVAGYGLAFQNGAPIEFIRPVSKPDKDTLIAGQTDTNSENQNDYDPVDTAHESVEAFADRHADGSVTTNPRTFGTEPEWTFLGWVEMDNQAKWTYEPWGKDERTDRVGKIKIKAEVYRGPQKNDGSALWVGKLVAQQWPGKVLSPGSLGETYRNSSLFMSQDWYEGHNEGLEMTEFGPEIDKEGKLDWSLTLGASSGGAEGGITASYDVPRMSRTNVSKDDRSVAHEYGYPSEFGEQSSKASRQRIQVENIGEFELTPPTQQHDTLFGLEISGDFESIQNNDTGVGPSYPSKTTGVNADISVFDLA